MKMINPLVTISIPLYNCADFLEACLESVRLQTYAHIEVTLINDQTPDNSVQIAEEFIQKHQLENWRIIHLAKNSGLSVVRNKGIDTALGKYIFFVDSDDQLFPETIALMVGCAEESQMDLVVGNVETVNVNTGVTSDMFKIDAEEKSLKGNIVIFEAFVKGKYPTTSWNKLISVNFLRNNKLYFTPGLYAQDALHSFQVGLKLESIGFVQEKTYQYFLHENSVIHNRNKKHFDNWMTIASEIDACLKSEKSSERRHLILLHLIEFKNITLIMNWRAQKNEQLWKESYCNYKTLTKLNCMDYFSNRFSKSIKKADLFNRLPTYLGLKLFKWRWGR